VICDRSLASTPGGCRTYHVLLTAAKVGTKLANWRALGYEPIDGKGLDCSSDRNGGAHVLHEGRANPMPSGPIYSAGTLASSA
jgi:hypothetical protein